MAAYTRGTIYPARDFNAETLCNRLKKAMKGLGTDEKTIIEVLSHCDNRQRQELKTRYMAMFGKDLCSELKSELGGNFEELVLALMTPPLEYLIDWIHKAMKGLGTDEQTLIEILCGRTNYEIHAIKEAYARKYNTDLQRAIQSELSGDFCRLMRACLAGAREENPHVDVPRAQQDAQELYQAGVGRMGTDESKFITVLNTRSFFQLRETFNFYQQYAKHTIEDALNRELSGDFRDGLLAMVKIVRDAPSYFAERLNKSMRGMGTLDSNLIRVIVSRSEIDLADIKIRYHQLYAAHLSDAIKGETSGDYKKLLLKIVDPV